MFWKANWTFFYGDENYPVEAGDCLFFNSSVPHKVVSAADKEAVRILSVLLL